MVVLVMISLAVLLLTRMIESGSTDLLIAMRQADRDRLRADVHGALETTLAVLMDFRTLDGGLYSPVQGWDDPLGYAGYTPREGVTIEVGFEDESGKISLPVVSLEGLKALLAEEGLTPADAARVADAMFAWMRPGHLTADNAARVESYAWRPRPLAPPLRSPRSFEELADIAVAGEFFYVAAGRPTPLLARFRRLVSLYRFAATNLNAAPPAVLVASGWNKDQADDFQRQRSAQDVRRRKPYFRTVQEAGGPGGSLGASIQLLRINVTAKQGAARLRLSALVTWDGQAVLPLPVVRESDLAADSRKKQAPAASQQEPAGTKATDFRYPFTILELSESALPVSPDEHEPAV